jgi:hypothetical protein
MELSEEQKLVIAAWIEAGAGLSEVQKRLKDELGVSMTYLEARLLVDDLRLRVKDPEKPAAAKEEPSLLAPEPPSATGKVAVSIDQITRPGAMVSGRVTFADGEKAEWYLDTAGRLGLNPTTPGYRPSQKDVMDFQTELEKAARAQGL